MSVQTGVKRTAPPSRGARVGRLFGRTAVILLASALVTLATIALASSPAGTPLTNAMAPAVAKPGGAQRPAGAPVTGQQTGQQPGQGATSADAPVTAPAGRPAGTPGGRNVSSLQRGLPDVLKYGGVMAGTTLVVVLVLRAIRPNPRRRPISTAPLAQRN